MWSPYMGWMGGWMWIPGLVILVLLIRFLTGSPRGFSFGTDDTPEQILKRRYAKGEIERDEYQRRLEDLRR